ncbi:hypothetical protein [Actinocorallia populi]|uniref:hypothetical protein n=1 Tax=Actinocorallia populi TaxID=2079200 RepID=UPI000D0911CA|nr:hypothetical protein [Actinocorallia populi]
MSVASKVILAGTLASASVVAASPAEAAKSCVLGKWKSTSYTMLIQGAGAETHGSGLKGVRLTVSRTSLAYDFNKSTKEELIGYNLGDPSFRSQVKYAKKLSVKATVRGAKKGSVVLKPRTATGDATGANTRTWPEHENLSKWKLAKSLRTGTPESFVPVKSSFSCSGKTLKFFSSYKHRGYTVSIGRVFTRA